MMLLYLHEAYEVTLMSQLKVASILCSWLVSCWHFYHYFKMSRVIKGKLQKLPKRPERKGPATTLGLSFNCCVAVTPHSMYSVYHQLCCCLLDGVNRPAEQRICQMFLAGFRIQSEILKDLRTQQFQQIAVSFFVTRIIGFAWGVTKSKTWDPQRTHTPGKTQTLWKLGPRETPKDLSSPWVRGWVLLRPVLLAITFVSQISPIVKRALFSARTLDLDLKCIWHEILVTYQE